MPRGQSPWADAADIISAKIKLIFDVGANVGQTSMELTHAFPDAQIYGFEPIQPSYALFEQNTGSLKNVTGFPIGFSTQRKSSQIFLQEDSTWNSLSKNIDRGLGDMEIELDTIDGFCHEHGITHRGTRSGGADGRQFDAFSGAC
jgi:FkbM family methyltransferase